MTYKLHREVAEGRITRLSLGVAEVDEYLKFRYCQVDCVKFPSIKLRMEGRL
jgi:hypothetical protein